MASKSKPAPATNRRARSKPDVLSAAEDVFVQAIVRDQLSQADAYRRAFPRSANWKAETVHEHASRLAATGKVAARIDALRAIARETVEAETRMGAAEWAARCVEVLMFDIGIIYDENGQLLPPHKLPPIARRMVESVEYFEGGAVKKYGFPKRAQWADMMGRYLGVYRSEGAKDPLQGWTDLMARIAENGRLQPVVDVEFKERVVVDRAAGVVPGALVAVERESEGR